MDFFEVIKKRYSVRLFKKQKIEEEKLEKILTAANLAPSAGNLQAYEIFVVKDLKKRKLFASLRPGREWIATAPVVLVFCANLIKSSSKFGKRGKKLYCLQDATIAAAYAQLAACALGLGTCWIGSFFEDEILNILGNPKGLTPICLMPIGYPAEESKTKERRRLEDITRPI